MVAGSAIYDQPSPGRGLAGVWRARRGRVNERDAELLERALDLAERGRRSASPNPLVGCVIARDGRVLGEGWHVRRGEPHAERNALDACREPVAGATAYVSLEPCSHHGRQPPCADALIAAGIARVVCAIGDPNPEVDGRGLRAPARGRRRRSSSQAGDLEARARRQNAAFRTHVVRGRPFVLLKLAATLDGRIATSSGREPLDLLAREPRARARLAGGVRRGRRRQRHGAGRRPRAPRRAICEPPAERLPLRVVFDRRGRLGAGSQARADRGERARRARRAAGRAAAARRRRGARRRPRSRRRSRSGRARGDLAARRGRSRARGRLLRAGLVDALALFLAPRADRRRRRARCSGRSA